MIKLEHVNVVAYAVLTLARLQSNRPNAYSRHVYFKRFVFYKFYSHPVVSEP